MAIRQEPVFIGLTQALTHAHKRLFPEEPYKHPKTLQTIALALSALMPILRRDPLTGRPRELTSLELEAEPFTQASIDLLLVSKIRFDAALDTLQVASLDQARASLTLRQSQSLSRRRA
jgi:hypothetical protein